jgi:hypothetical protein
MADPTDAGDGPELRYGDPPSVSAAVDADRVVSVLFGSDVEAWRRRWERTAAGPPQREAVIEVTSVVRSGAAASTPVVPTPGLAYTVVDGAEGCDGVVDAVADHLDGAPAGSVDVIVDDLAALAGREGIDAAVGFVERLCERTAERVNAVTVGCSTEGPAGLVSRLGARTEVRIGAEASAVAAVERLYREDPTTFGYVRRHWAEATAGIEACERNYPQSKQVHAAIRDPETTPRTLGAALSGLVTLGVLDTWSETVGPTRYDLTAYRPDRARAVGRALDADVTEE